MTTPSFDERSVDIAEHERRAAVILDGMYQFVALLTPRGDILEVNRAALEGAGHRIQEIRGKPFWTARWWQVSEQILKDLQVSIGRAAAGEFVRYEVDIYGEQSGRIPITIDFSLQPIRGESGQVEYLLAEGRNITERKRAEEQVGRQARELRVLNERLQELDRLKTQFFANVSHEFRTPLTLMLGPLEDALANAHGILPLGAARDLEVSHGNALRLLKLVNTMLDFSRIEAGRIQASYERVDLPALTAELASNFRSACEKAGLRLVVDCPALSGCEVYVDRDMWEKMVLNLLSNAFKFTLTGEIDVRLQAANGHARLTVRDTGVGIPSDELPRMFERFHRVEHSRGRTHEGTEISLAFVQELVKLHGGTVRVDSVLGEGSTFTITIPFGTAHLDPERIGKPSELASTAIASAAFVEEALRWLPDAGAHAEHEGGQARMPASAPSHGDPPAAQPRGPRARILWADDNADMRAYVSGLLAGRFDVQAVADGQAALEAARVEPPDLVLSDIMMPRLDGFGLLLALRADPKLRDVPIILLSARAGEESRLEGLNAGADDYLIKPFSARELVARVDTHVKMSRLRREAEAALRESERRLSTLVSSLPGMAYRCRSDASGTMEFVSEGVTDITGYAPDDFTSGRLHWRQLQHPDDVGWTWEAVRSAAREHRPFRVEYRIRHKDGSERWVWQQGQSIDNGPHESGAVEGFVADITERKRTEQATGLLSAIVDSSDDAIISKSLDGVITSWNKSAERVFGYTAAEAVGQPITMLIPLDRRDEEPKILERLARGERVDHFETIRVRKDGSRLDISLTISPVRDAAGRIVGASKVARDITDQRRAQERLREQTETLEVLHAIGKTLSGELDLTRLVQAVTDVATRLTGAAWGAFYYRGTNALEEFAAPYTVSGAPREAFAHFPVPRNTALFGPTFRGDSIVRIDDVTRDARYGRTPPHRGMPPGHLPVRSYLAVPVTARGGEVLGGISFGHPDVGVFSERHEQIVAGIAAQAAIAIDNARLYEAEHRARAEAEEANRAKDQFLATLSHELRTPLSAIYGWAHIMRLGPRDDAQLSRALEIIERNARIQAKLIDDLLDVSRIVAGKMRLDVAPVDFIAVIDSALESVRVAAESRGVVLHATVEAVEHIQGDAARLQQVVGNLLSNAVKFTPAGGHVYVRLSGQGTEVVLTVRDTGCGISFDALPHIFERFRQADESLTRPNSGLGIGLTIVKHLVEAHGGTVTADSAGPNAGATFTVRLPVAHTTGSLLIALPPKGPAAGVGRSLAGLRILVVEDDEDVRDFMGLTLDSHGAETVAVGSAAEALAVFASSSFDAIVSDIAMPAMDGYALLEQIRQLDLTRGRQTLAVAVTAFARVEDRERALRAGYQAHVTKPIEPGQLVATIGDLAVRGGRLT